MKIMEYKKIDPKHDNIYFMRIEPEDLSITIKQIIEVLFNLSWISQFDKEYIRSSFKKRATDTAQYLSRAMKLGDDSKVTSDTGEYVVSELAREAIVSQMGYQDIPLAELFKEQVIGNPGFDYYSATKNKIIVFGEAKYISRQNAYGSGMNQVARFIKEGQDISDLNDIDKFFDEDSLKLANNGEKAYSIAFSSKTTSSNKIVENILKHKQYDNLAKHKEVHFVAVNV